MEMLLAIPIPHSPKNAFLGGKGPDPSGSCHPLVSFVWHSPPASGFHDLGAEAAVSLWKHPSVWVGRTFAHS